MNWRRFFRLGREAFVEPDAIRPVFTVKPTVNFKPHDYVFVDGIGVVDLSKWRDGVSDTDRQHHYAPPVTE